MRRRQAPSELLRLAEPLVRAFEGAWRRMHWWVALMALLYAVSGITVIGSDEVAVVLRWGRLVGDTPATQVHGSGLLFAFPRPVDQVVRVSTQHVRELLIQTLAPPAGTFAHGDTLDPLTIGYALTGDDNIVHVSMVARYRVRDPAEWAFYGPESETIFRTEVTAAMVRSLGEVGVDHVLAEGRKHLIAQVTERSQAGLDAAHSGLALVSLELTRLDPPETLLPDFDAVQSAYIGAETGRRDAEAFAQIVIPQAHAEADAAVQTAQADAATALSQTKGEVESFLDLEREARGNPIVVREGLYRSAVEKAIGGTQQVRWLPPPSGEHPGEYRIEIPSNGAGPTQGQGPSTTPNPLSFPPPSASPQPAGSPQPSLTASPAPSITPEDEENPRDER